jgi:hypothetical protein
VLTSVLSASSPCMNGPSMITVAVSGSTWEIAVGGPSQGVDGAVEVAHATAIATTTGNTLSLTYSCMSSPGYSIPDSGIQTFQYSVTAAGFQLLTSDSALSLERQSADGGGLDAGATDASLDAGPGDSASTDAKVADGSDSAPTDAGASDASFACALPPDPAPLVQDTASCAAPPAPAGGTIVDGTYYLTSAVAYPGDAGCSQTLTGQSQGTIVVSGGKVSIVVVNGENPPGTPPGWEIATTPTASTSFDSTCICGTFSSCLDGGGGAAPARYTATSTTLVIFPSNPVTGFFAFTKQ